MAAAGITAFYLENLPLDNTDWNVRIRKHDGVRYVFAGIDKDLFADQSVARALLNGLSISSVRVLVLVVVVVGWWCREWLKI